nr:transposase, MuDR, MULE transposase domain protein [Tanacetum cinerariifolium]
LSTIDYVNVDGGIVTGCFGDVKKFLKNWKLEKVVVVIKSCIPNALGDLTVALKDFSGIISGTIHYKVLTEERFAKAITVEVFIGKIVGGRDQPVITLLKYIREYCMKRIMNVQGMIDKCIGSLTPTATKIIESIKKEAHLMKVQLNRANKYQVSSLLDDQCVMDVVEPMQKPVVVNLEPRLGQDGSGGSGVGAIIGLSAAAGECGVGGLGVASQGSSHSRSTKIRVQSKRIGLQKELPLNLQVNLLPVLKCQ